MYSDEGCSMNVLSGNDSVNIDQLPCKEKPILSKSRVAKNRIEIVSGVKISISDTQLTAVGNGELKMDVPSCVSITIDNGYIVVREKDSRKFSVSMAGTCASNIKNIIEGLVKGFAKKLLLTGVGYRAAVSASVLTMNLGFSHPVKYNIPTGIDLVCTSATELAIKGCDKSLVGLVASQICRLRKYEPYNATGITDFDKKSMYIRKGGDKKK
jgi:large subunit ribosomal protein L6